jgi:hypothetical protein
MADTGPEIAAATLEHGERIRLLADRVDRQRRTITKLSYAVGILFALQAVSALGVSKGMAGMGLVIGLAVWTLTLALPKRAVGI